MSILLPKNHLTYTAIATISELCQPLLYYFNINSFCFRRKYRDKTIINFGSRFDWLNHFYTQGLYLPVHFDGNIDDFSNGYYVWPNLDHYCGVDSNIFYHARTYFDIGHGVALVRKSNHYCDFYFFGVSVKDAEEVGNRLISNMDCLEHFIFYFKDQCHELIAKAEAGAGKISLPGHISLTDSKEFFSCKDQDKDKDKNARKSFFNETKVKKYYLNVNDDEIFLSRRERAIAAALLDGKSAKEIADALFLSKRTVENHLEHIKSKMNCYSKFELLRKLVGVGLASNNKYI